MSYFIDVDYTEFEKAAAAVEDYLAKQKQKLQAANQEVTALGAVWAGDDYEAFQAKWNELDESSSTAVDLAKNLEDYAKTLRYVRDLYKDAQRKAIDRANSL